MYVDEFGPLLRAWRQHRLGTRAEFWSAQPWEIAAELGIGPYAPPESPETPPVRPGGPRARPGVRSRPGPGDGVPEGVHPRPQMDLLRQRVAHAKDPENVPAPRPVQGGVPFNPGALT